MAFTLGYSTLRWREPDLEVALEELKKAGWDGWEGRLPLDWLGTPARLRRVCKNAGMPLLVYTADGSPDNRDPVHVERNKRRMEFAAEMDADCFMFMNAAKPPDHVPSDDELKAAADGAEEWAEFAHQLGLELSYHIHTNMLVDSIDDWRTYMSYLDTAKLCIDVSHAQLWGYDPVQSIRRFPLPAQLHPSPGLVVHIAARGRILSPQVVRCRRLRERRLPGHTQCAGRHRLQSNRHSLPG